MKEGKLSKNRDKVKTEDLLSVATQLRPLLDRRKALERERDKTVRDTLLGELRRRIIQESGVLYTTAQEYAMIREVCEALGVSYDDIKRQYGV